MSDDKQFDPPSDEFMRAFCGGGTPVQRCDFCGRTNFDYNGEFMEEGELEGLLRKRSQEPDHYFGQDGGISFGELNGRTLVWGCPCNKTRPYEDFIWSHRLQITEYLKARIADRLRRAQSEADRVKDLNPCS